MTSHWLFAGGYGILGAKSLTMAALMNTTNSIMASLKRVKPDTQLYVNYPLCAARCSFCIYHICRYTRENAELFRESYPREIALYAAGLGGFKFRDLHIGGGTPNLASAEQLLEPLRPLAAFGGMRSFVIEVSPRADLAAYVGALRKYGLTKVMLGVQALDPAVLKGEGRFMPRRTILDNIRMLSETGLSWSVDLIYGLNQHGSERDHISELKTIIKHRPSGLHLYNIRIQAENGFYNRDDTVAGRMKFMGQFDYAPLCEILLDNGYRLIGDEWCLRSDRENTRLAVQNAEDYGESNTVGIGPGARSRNRLIKYINVRDLVKYAGLLDRSLFPVGGFFSYADRLYLVADFLLECNASSRFHLRRHLESGEFSSVEKTELVRLVLYLKKSGIGLTEKGGVLDIPRQDWSRCMLLTEKYLTEKGGTKYFYKN